MLKKMRLPRRHFDLIGGKLQQECSAIIANKFLRPVLRLLPGRADLIQEFTTLIGNLQRQAPTVFAMGNFYYPAVAQHYLEVPGQRRRIEMEEFADADTPDRADLCDYDEEIKLGRFQAERAQLVIVNPREHAVELARATQQALAGYAVNDAVISFHGLFCSVFPGA